MQIDIIVPVFNVAPYLDKCIQSLLNQNYDKMHIIIIDDGSTDGSGDICDAYGTKYNHIDVYHTQNNGLSEARNYGLTFCSAEYIMFIDSDDWLSENAISLMMETIQKVNADIVSCQTINEFETFSILPKSEKSEFTTLDTEDALYNLLLRKGITISAWAKIYKRSLFENIYYPKGQIHEDIPVTTRIISRAKNVVILNKALYHYRQTPDSLSRREYTNRNRALYDFCRDISFVVDLYPKLDEAYKGFFLVYMKSLVTMFVSNKSKMIYKSDYEEYIGVLKSNILSTLCNRTLSIKEKISILTISSPLRVIIKKLYFHLKRLQNDI